MKHVGFKYQVKWGNPYRDPEEGRPLVKITRYETIEQRDARVEQGGDYIPEEITQAHVIGDGYAVCITAVVKPIKPMPASTLASVRQKRLRRRMLAKYPLFAEQMIEEEIAKNIHFYQGITRPDLKADYDAAIEREVIEYETFLKEVAQ